VDAELADFVTGGGYDTAAVDAADDDGLAGGLRVVALFNRCIERIHVNMKNSARYCHGLRPTFQGVAQSGDPRLDAGAARRIKRR
jgi:hypothetical protein